MCPAPPSSCHFGRKGTSRSRCCVAQAQPKLHKPVWCSSREIPAVVPRRGQDATVEGTARRIMRAPAPVSPGRRRFDDPLPRSAIPRRSADKSPSTRTARASLLTNGPSRISGRKLFVFLSRIARPPPAASNFRHGRSSSWVFGWAVKWNQTQSVFPSSQSLTLKKVGQKATPRTRTNCKSVPL